MHGNALEAALVWEYQVSVKLQAALLEAAEDAYDVFAGEELDGHAVL